MSEDRMERRKETAVVKKALRAYGINAYVSHGKGTGWGWLKVNVGTGNGYLHEKVIEITQRATGRHGEYDGNINVHCQAHWNVRLEKAEPILQPGQPLESATPKESPCCTGYWMNVWHDVDGYYFRCQRCDKIERIN